MLAEIGIKAIDGFLLDVGVSSHQLDTVERGFSFQHDAPLDMRMDQSAETTAAELVNTLSEEDLCRVIREYGEERWAKRIAAFIIKRREETPIATTLQLVDVIKAAVPKVHGKCAFIRQRGPFRRFALPLMTNLPAWKKACQAGSGF